MNDFKQLLSKLEPLLGQFAHHVQQIAEIVHKLIVLDPKQAKTELRKRGLAEVTVNRLNAVALGTVDARLLLHGTVTANLLERYLSVAEQRKVLDKGVDLVIGNGGGKGRTPKYVHRAFAELTDREGRQIVDKDNRCLRTLQAQANYRTVRVPKKEKRTYRVDGNTITFYSSLLLKKVLRFLEPRRPA